MVRRFVISAFIPAVTLALTGAIGLTPAAASSATWQINSVVGNPASQPGFSTVVASSADNAWAGGLTNCDSSCATQMAMVEQWNGQSWQPVTLPDSNLGGAGQLPVIGTSSASNTWIFDSDINFIGYGVHVTDSGMTEMAMPASGGIQFTGAAVFGPDDAWAFGITGDFNLANFSAYAAHYDGQTWTQLPTPPVVPETVSALSSNDLWVMGVTTLAPSASSPTYEAAHWTGSGWTTIPLPDANGLQLPQGAQLQPSGILALSDSNVWVTSNISVGMGFGPGVAVLRWDGRKWSAADVPGPKTLGQFDADIAYDGQGGFWVSGNASLKTFSGPYLYHYQNGDWSSQLAPLADGIAPGFGGLAWIPGTTSLWGAATLLTTLPDGTQGSLGAIYQYGP